MSSEPQEPEVVLKRLGNVQWSKAADAFIVNTEFGAILQLCPNSDDDIGAGVHIDEINVPENLRGNGRATKAMIALCRLADEYNFELAGGPVGWSDAPGAKGSPRGFVGLVLNQTPHLVFQWMIELLFSRAGGHGLLRRMFFN